MSFSEGDVWLENEKTERLNLLKWEIETVLGVIATVDKRASVCLFGSVARKLLGNKTRPERHKFSLESDGDIWIELSRSGRPGADSKKVLLLERFIGDVGKAAIINTLFPGFNTNEKSQAAFADAVEHQEAIVLYENGQFTIPWRESDLQLGDYLTKTVSREMLAELKVLK